jgi:uncharacterized membrane protein
MKRSTQLRSAIAPTSRPADIAANLISDALGSLWFLLICLTLIICYITWNSGLIKSLRPFDPSPFNILDTILSVFAIVLSVSVLISQKRQRRLERIREQVEFEVNIRAEKEITKILTMLHEIQTKMGIAKSDKELDEMKKELDIKEIHDHIKNDHA